MTSDIELTEKENNDLERFQWGGVLLISFCHMIHDVYTSFLSPLLPLLIEKLSINLTQAGLLGTIVQLPSLLNPLIGRWADKGDRARFFIILGPVMTSVPMSLLGLAPNYSVAMLILFVVGISTSVLHVPGPVMVGKLSGYRKGLGMSLFMIGGEFSRTIGPLTAVWAVSRWGLEGYYPVMIVGIVASFMVYIRFRNIPIEIIVKKPVSLRESYGEIKHVMKPLTFILFSRGFMHGSLATFLPVFIKQETGSLWLAGAALALYEASGVLGIFTAGPLSDRIGRKRVLAFQLMFAPFFLFMFILSTGWLKAGALILTGFSLLSTTPVMLAMIQEHAKNSPSAANGFYMMTSFIARSAVVVLIGYCGDLVGLKITYFLSAGMGLIGIPFLFMLPDHGSK
ncbi:MAG: MFS transporter [Deltaproteobacteria bacterium]|nr:MFS transporter [Deltaproteobacteria bacterium]